MKSQKPPESLFILLKEPYRYKYILNESFKNKHIPYINMAAIELAFSFSFDSDIPDKLFTKNLLLVPVVNEDFAVRRYKQYHIDSIVGKRFIYTIDRLITKIGQVSSMYIFVSILREKVASQWGQLIKAPIDFENHQIFDFVKTKVDWKANQIYNSMNYYKSVPYNHHVWEFERSRRS